MNLTYQNIIREILEKFPEYKDTEYYENNDQELQYSFFSGFSDYINELLLDSKMNKNDEKIKLAFSFFNEMIESEDDKLSNLAVVEVLESLIQEKQGKDACKDLLREEGQKQLQEVLKYTGIED